MEAWFVTALIALGMVAHFVSAGFRTSPRLVPGPTVEFESLEMAQARYDRRRQIRFALAYVAPLLLLLLLALRYGQMEFVPNRIDQLKGEFLLLIGAFMVGTTLCQTILAREASRLAKAHPEYADSQLSVKSRLALTVPGVVPVALFPMMWTQELTGLLVIAGLFLGLALVGRRMQMQELTRNQLVLPEDSPLAIRIAEVCAKMQVPTPKIVIFPSVVANAAALPNGAVLVTTAMRRIATDDEIAAILAHEFSHVRDKEGKKYEWLQRMVLLGPSAVVGFGLMASMTIMPGAYALPGLICLMPYAFFPLAVIRARITRPTELKCDADAKKVGLGPELVSALEKISRSSGLPPRWTGHDRWVITHPDLVERTGRLRSDRQEA